MCKILEDMCKEDRAEGYAEGYAEGLAEAKNARIASAIYGISLGLTKDQVFAVAARLSEVEYKAALTASAASNV